MIRHIAMFRWAAGATDEQRAAVPAGLAGLPAAIPTIRAYTYGPDLAENEGNFEFAIVADFDDVAGYRTYRDHPAHQAFIHEVIAPIRGERASVQFEV